jgi:hypothetical protein
VPVVVICYSWNFDLVEHAEVTSHKSCLEAYSVSNPQTVHSAFSKALSIVIMVIFLGKETCGLEDNAIVV